MLIADAVENITKTGVARPVMGPMPPHAVFSDFLPDGGRRALLDWAIEHQADFKPAKIFYGESGREDGLNPDVRIALKHYGIGPCEAILTEQLKARLPEIFAAVGYHGPEPQSIEFEVNAYGDGAHFAPHIDIPVGAGRRTVGKLPGEDRVISAVYYFYREPKAFTGGALRLYRFGADPDHCGEDDVVSFEPVQNRLVVFPSWARHGVERVSSSSSDFGDHRFALNCWFCRKLSD